VRDGPELGTEVAGYRLESVLGEGGMGTVYLARGPEGGICALKVLSRRLLEQDPSFATRFKREAQYAEALDHPHVVELYGAGETPDGTLYFAMQYVDGPDLGVLIKRNGAFSLRQALSVLAQIGDALDCAHATGLVHRDVKPGNIIVADDPGGLQAYLADFGLSKNRTADSIALTKKGQLIGTMSYTAPEEIMGSEGRDHRVDIYSLGCVLYEAIVGAPPFVRERDIELLYAHVGTPRPSATAARPDLPAGIDDVIATAMAISPVERYASCNELIAAARALLPGEEELHEPDAAGFAPAVPAAITGPAHAATPVTSEPAPAEVGAPPGALLLTVRSAFGSGLTITVEDELVLGRLTTLEGALTPDHSISRRHARITRADDGGFVVQDEHSRNGTYVNDARIDTPHALRTGDELKIGSTVFVATVPDPPTENTTDEPAGWVETPQAESTTDAPAGWVEAPQAESTTDPPVDWVETPQAESTPDAPADWVEAPQAESTTDAPADWVEAPQAESTTDAPADWVETPQAESTTDAPADWVETPQADSTTDAPADWVETPQAESAIDAPQDWVETPQAESAIDAPASAVEAPQAEGSANAPADLVETPQAEGATDTPSHSAEALQAGEVVIQTGEPGTRLALRLEFDLEAGEVIVAIENGATVRLVRHGDEWYVESA
jgi:hypothetical protein